MTDSTQLNHASVWPFWRRWLLNFGTLYLVLYFLVFGQRFLVFIPNQWLYTLGDALHQLLHHRHLPPYGTSGSGDSALDWTLTLFNLLFSMLAGTLWTAFNKNKNPRQQVNILRSFLRFSLAVWLLVYGLSKFGFMQFGLLNTNQMATTYGESSPMGLLWRFMAASPGYQWLAGVAETLPALLLLHRRTVTLGAIIAAITMTNVFAINLFYDVPVKLFSGHLLLTAGVLMLMDAGRLLAFALGRAAPPLDLPPSNTASRRGSWVLTVVGVLGIAYTTWQGVQRLSHDPPVEESYQTLLKTRGFHWVSERPFNR